MFKLRLTFILTMVVVSAVSAQTLAPSEKVIYSFKGGHDGSLPFGSLTADANGNLYGATAAGGNSGCFTSGCGTVFELTPQTGGGWKKTTLHVFTGKADGADPHSALMLDAAGNLYGLAESGGTVNENCQYGCGVVFELSPDSAGKWTETVLYSFLGGDDGFEPMGSLIFDASGNLYGTTYGGGGSNIHCTTNSCGTVFELSPNTKDPWTEQVLYRFNGSTDGSSPVSGVIQDSVGNLYGTTLYGGSNENGTVFELQQTGGSWKESVLYRFQGGGNAANPFGGVMFDTTGNIYGTLTGGGNGGGGIFELRPSGKRWKERILYFFCTQNNCVDGREPWSTLLTDAAGNLYGTTLLGGSETCPLRVYECGTAFELRKTKQGWQEVVLHEFGSGNDGYAPYAGLIFGANKTLIGSTVDGGTGQEGSVFEIQLPGSR